VLGRPESSVESYASAAEARERLAQRSESERVRFIERYGADKTRLRNYDLVCDSTLWVPKTRPHRSSGVSVFVEDATESIASSLCRGGRGGPVR
jgi:cytidylate kinase